MLNPWLALEAGADPVERAGAVRRAHSAFLADGTVQEPVRSVVADSWRRCAGARVAPDGIARVELTDADLRTHRAEHPLAAVMPLIRELLGGIAHDGAHLLTVCDAAGRLLWVEGHAQVRRRAEYMNLVAGARWSESEVGTNAPGTALAVDHAVQIFNAEHYCTPVQPWTCAAAPIHDPASGRLIGAVDITGGDHLAAPHSLALVQATARAAETQLAALGPITGDRLTLQALGRDEAVLHGGRTHGARRLSRRHSEIMLVLADHPEGLTGEALAHQLYGERDLSPITLRAELSRLRQLLGPLLRSRPYRLAVPVDTDASLVLRSLHAGDPVAALAAYRGPLLPRSEAPGVVRLRRLVETRLRGAVLAAGDRTLLEEWVRSTWGEDDLEAWEELHAVVPRAEQPIAAARVSQLRAEYGLRLPPRAATFPQPRRA
ncbi:GAF domain-containing protein [Streptomyces durbertensis]|uniref:GAF domain-containing protein n=1 Tax=Streptomyces durbertensis TaxID=2448886 RepID=A0ABR6EKR6_9ACTN|nr:GAF domain-containing protein [Streptomyces durbertensis]MBB1245907.1 GAF domain-containing protein [Streptomyces durbertensis]